LIITEDYRLGVGIENFEVPEESSRERTFYSNHEHTRLAGFSDADE